MEEKILRTLRAQAWQRAKGELQAVLETYWDLPGEGTQSKDMHKAVRDFVEAVESDGLTE